MKLSIQNINICQTIEEIQQISVSVLIDGTIKYCIEDSFVYIFSTSMLDATISSTNIIPNDAQDGIGYWYNDNKRIAAICSLVDDSFDFESNNCTEITTFNNVKIFKELFIIDYKKWRAWLQQYQLSTGFDNLPSNEKLIIAQNFACNNTDIFSQLPLLSDREKYGNVFHIFSVNCRRQRMNKCVSVIYNRLQISDANEIINDVKANSLYDNYIDFGREGTLEGDPEGIFDYIESRVGTSYEDTGLASKSFTPIEGSLSDIVVKTIDILKNGNY